MNFTVTVQHDFSSLERALDKFAATLGALLLGASASTASASRSAPPVPTPAAITQSAPIVQPPFEAPAEFQQPSESLVPHYAPQQGPVPAVQPPAGTKPKRGRGRPSNAEKAAEAAAPSLSAELTNASTAVAQMPPRQQGMVSELAAAYSQPAPVAPQLPLQQPAPVAAAPHFTPSRDALAATVRDRAMTLARTKGAAVYTKIYNEHGNPTVATADEATLQKFLAAIEAAMKA